MKGKPKQVKCCESCGRDFFVRSKSKRGAEKEIFCKSCVTDPHEIEYDDDLPIEFNEDILLRKQGLL